MSASNSPALLEVNSFKALAVRLQAGLNTEGLDAALGSLGRMEGTRAWLSITALKALGPDETAWKSSFDAMISYADGAGWVSQDKALVRAHIDLSER
ncbi:hypothetical protein LJR130_006458 [Variovorax sp. LjRoot130]|uniref:hypothetical protein n=1 Tax=Variovorax sp. LjRoot130 TaxID=3342261 RepID=UPI003ECEBE13